MAEDGRPSGRGHPGKGCLYLIPLVLLRVLFAVLYIRWPADDPHQASRALPGQAKCGVPLAGSKQITEASALVYLQDRRCPACFPHHTQSQGRNAR